MHNPSPALNSTIQSGIFFSDYSIFSIVLLPEFELFLKKYLNLNLIPLLIHFI